MRASNLTLSGTRLKLRCTRHPRNPPSNPRNDSRSLLFRYRPVIDGCYVIVFTSISACPDICKQSVWFDLQRPIPWNATKTEGRPLLRFPNPGSDISSFIRIFCAIAEDLGSGPAFSLDDVSALLVRRNLASSSGYMGDEALARSFNEDRSRDRLYNQSKMYAELYRSLGWFQTPSDSRLSFRVSFFGQHVARAQGNESEIFRQSVIGIAYPSPVIDLRGDHDVRPFAAILRTLRRMDGLLCRDEMIVGPMCVSSDRKGRVFQEMIDRLKNTRGNSKALSSWMAEVSRSRGITENTMGNYTRFPLAVLEWTGWTTKERMSGPYKKSIVFHKLTALGAAAVESIEQSFDVRYSDVQQQKSDDVAAISRLGFYNILERSGFDISPVAEQLARDAGTAQSGAFAKSRGRAILFSPFQQLPPDTVNAYFDVDNGASAVPNRETSKGTHAHRATSRSLNNQYTVVQMHDSCFGNNFVRDSSTRSEAASNAERTIRRTFEKANRSITKTVDIIVSDHSGSNKEEFYPLVAALFQLLGMPCETSRHGINYQRWDAIIPSDTKSIPIEIKSPGEERFISIKGIRQALENKVILLSRRSYITDRDTASLLVGYNVPNDRAEVTALVADILRTYGIRVGIIDFPSLIGLAVNRVVAGKVLDLASLQQLTGLIDVKTA